MLPTTPLTVSTNTPIAAKAGESGKKEDEMDSLASILLEMTSWIIPLTDRLCWSGKKQDGKVVKKVVKKAVKKVMKKESERANVDS